MPLAMSVKWFADDDIAALAMFRNACDRHRASIVDQLVPILCECDGDCPFEGTTDAFWTELDAALAGNERALVQRLSAYGSHAACCGIDLRSLSERIERVRRRTVQVLIQSFGADPKKLESTLEVSLRLFDRVLNTITREYLLYREALVEEQRRREDHEHRRALELEAENVRIQAANRTKSEFLANMSHELRTPLNSIIGFADLLHDGEIAPHTVEHREFLSDILKSARHLLKLINDVLDLAKVEAGKMEFRPEMVELPYLLCEVLDVVQSQAIKREVHLRQDVEDDLAVVYTDPARLRQVLYNYLSNAIKFSEAGSTVTLRARADGETFRIEVQDEGPGIAERDLSRLFMEFEQLQGGQERARLGTGLGLALTKRIVEAQGGQVGVRSKLGLGSTFWVSFPADDDRSRARPESYFEELRPKALVKIGEGA